MNNKDRDFIIELLEPFTTTEGRANPLPGTINDFKKAVSILEDDKLDIVVNAKTNPAAVGEYLRNEFFNQDTGGWTDHDMSNYSYGCYSTFELRDDVTELPDEPVTYPCDCTWRRRKDNSMLGSHIGPPNPNCKECMGLGEYSEGFTWTRAEKDGVKMRYYWDGDGTLIFELPDGSQLVNTDCKKAHHWDWEEKE